MLLKIAAIAQWIRLCLPSCHLGFESHAQYQHFYQFVFELCHVEKTKINEKEAGIGPFFKKIDVIRLGRYWGTLSLCFLFGLPPWYNDFVIKPNVDGKQKMTFKNFVTRSNTRTNEKHISPLYRSQPAWQDWATFQSSGRQFSSSKSDPNVLWSFGLLAKTSLSSETCCSYFLANICNILGNFLFQHQVAPIVTFWNTSRLRASTLSHKIKLL